MDVFIRQRPPSVARATPVLRVLEISRVLQHEDPDPGRVRRLVRALRRDGVLRNPPIVTPIAGGDLVVVLDGANRVSALREMGVSDVAAQVVDYEASEISVSTWRHYVLEPGESLRKRIAARLGMGIVPAAGPDEAERRLGRGDGIAGLFDGDGTAVVGPGMDPVENAGLLGSLVDLYAGTSETYRTDNWDVVGMSHEFGRGTVVIFPPFGKRDVLKLATGGMRLPAGITRHLIPGRVLRLNVPLAWLVSPEGIAIKQSRLDQTVEERWRAHEVRHYAEATYLFDE